MGSILFFVNIGANIAKSMATTLNTNTGRMGNRIMQRMFPGEVNELEILPNVRKCESKRSTDSDGLDITIVKKRIIDCIIKPLTFICNLSIQSGVFPEHMKVATVILLFRNRPM